MENERNVEKTPETNTRKDMSAVIEVTDVLEELRTENSRLYNELCFADKCLHLLQELRLHFKQLNHNCKCSQTLAQKLAFNRLETTYKCLRQRFQHSIHTRRPARRPTSLRLSIPPMTVRAVGSNRRKSRGEDRAHKLKRIAIESQIIRQINNNRSTISSNCVKNSPTKVSLIDPKSVDNNSKSDLHSNNGFHFNTCVRFNPNLVDNEMDNKSVMNVTIECIGCDLKFSVKKRLLDHIRNTHDDMYDRTREVFTCDLKDCSYSSDRYRGLAEHKMKHKGIKPFKNTHLIVHKASHEGLKPFACDWPSCGQAFRSNSNLKHHCLIHTNEKPYKCEWPGCEAIKLREYLDIRFRSLSSRIRHGVVHRGTADFTCNWDGCGKTFKFKGKFQVRLKGIIFYMKAIIDLSVNTLDVRLHSFPNDN
ncbi:unnamed protein product [Medioppia subpectinata]|uniref:C2H2-type domain-containing protein n=1 Tax=Medioppia subpectinata TaxID=1979941 RepID=A0A7R9PXE4_9ACAR|nr:unnamed protein product [Medioppia subpectinata]CAG2104732.1 unnamed protein product [Medioppia subpectinata]